VIHGGSAGSAALALVIPWFYWASKVQTKASSMKASKGTSLYVDKKKSTCTSDYRCNKKALVSVQPTLCHSMFGTIASEGQLFVP
jgi:hypothetical protein